MSSWTKKPTNDSLVDQLVSEGNIEDEKSISALRKVDRKFYVLEKNKSSAYFDRPLGIGHEATISAPHMHAMTLELLKDDLNPDLKEEPISVLDVGSGSGFFTAVMGVLVSRNGKVVGIEHIPKLVEFGSSNIKNGNPELLEKGIVKIVEGDGRLGYEENAPYDVIHVGACAKNGVPEKLIEQLKVGGKIVIPVEKSTGRQYLECGIKKKNGKLETSQICGVRISFTIDSPIFKVCYN
ncbi:protein-l-isoaspartate(d-aspartate) o-methyltransferase [Anaeramoeba flamelloides]|uniref:Protein-L-isoaspartate O-methyltransferase n=1 Tax=Anaeramoeba flamelloides TaxID=1746091 RepID=A0AAV7ZC90_9EUKA|nr:protein-l-isoaspartate(d-aspartate) o-methyltransferase [Anaeramoeba flamelloides]